MRLLKTDHGHSPPGESACHLALAASLHLALHACPRTGITLRDCYVSETKIAVKIHILPALSAKRVPRTADELKCFIKVLDHMNSLCVFWRGFYKSLELYRTAGTPSRRVIPSCSVLMMVQSVPVQNLPSVYSWVEIWTLRRSQHMINVIFILEPFSNGAGKCQKFTRFNLMLMYSGIM